MGKRRITDPGVVDRIDVNPPDPEPADCLPPGETPKAAVSLSPGWIAVTDREFLRYHPECDPAVARAERWSVDSVALRRRGGRALLGYVPGAALYAVVAVAVGGLLLAVSPSEVVAVPDAPGTGGVETIVGTLAWASRLLGSVLLFSGILVGLCAVAVVGYWFLSDDVAVVLDRGSADAIECPTDRRAGQRAIDALREADPERAGGG